MHLKVVIFAWFLLTVADTYEVFTPFGKKLKKYFKNIYLQDPFQNDSFWRIMIGGLAVMMIL